MKQKKDYKTTSRRKFLKIGATAGAGALVGGGILSSITQTTSAEGIEKVKLLTQDGKLVEVDKSNVHCASGSKINPRKGMRNKKMVMVIDLSKCRNARKCVTGCQKMHHLPPETEWIK